MRRILIVSPAVNKPEYMDYISKALGEEHEIAFCFDGNDVHSMILEHDPELIFLDLHMPNADGLAILHDIRISGNTVPVVASANYLTGYIVAQLIQLRVTSIVQGPVIVDKMVEELRELIDFIEQDMQWSDEEELDYILQRLGLKSGPRFNAIRYCIMAKRENINIGLTKELYPIAAKQLQMTAFQIEKGIRYSIRQAMTGNTEALWRAYFPSLGTKEYPTNEEFFNRMVTALRDRERPQKMSALLNQKIVNY